MTQNIWYIKYIYLFLYCMKNKNLIYIIALLVLVIVACKSDKPTYTPSVDGFVRDIGTQKALGGLSISVIGTDGRSEYTAATTNTDATGFFKTDFETQSGYSYQLRCKDSAHSNPTWLWVDVNQKYNPYHVSNSGEDLTKEKTQHKDMWMGRYAEYDSIEFNSAFPFLKGDSIRIYMEDKYKFFGDFNYIRFKYYQSDSTYKFYFKGSPSKFLADSYIYLDLSGYRMGSFISQRDSFIVPHDQKKAIKIDVR